MLGKRALFTLLLFTQLRLFGAHAVTSESLTNGFGDQLLCYLHAKWVAMRYQLPMLYKPFPGSEQLVLHTSELHYQENFQKYRIKKVNNLEQIEKDSTRTLEPTLYVVPYFPESRYERAKYPKDYPYVFDVEWKNPEFREMMQRYVSPASSLETVKPPSDVISVAIHYRTGYGRDNKGVREHFPTKFAPLSFYVAGLKKVLELLPNYKIYVFLFSDCKDPKITVEKLAKEVASDRLDIAFQKPSCEGGVSQILSDFFSLFNFDIIIHSESNFSLVPTLLKDYALDFVPRWGHIEGGKIVIDQVECLIDEKSWQAMIDRPLQQL